MKSSGALIFAVSSVKCLFNEVLSDVEIRLNLFNKVQVNQLELKMQSSLKFNIYICFCKWSHFVQTEKEILKYYPGKSEMLWLAFALF